MKNIVSKKTIGLAAAALALVGALSVGGTMAYFTTYATASGTVPVSMSMTSTTPEESFDSWTKHVTVENSGQADAYVRVKAFSGSQYPLEFSGDGWTKGEDDYWYYDSAVAAGATSDPIDIKITSTLTKTDESTGETTTYYGDDFHVVVVEESTPVMYDEDGNAYADWDQEVAESNQTYTKEDTEGEE